MISFPLAPKIARIDCVSLALAALYRASTASPGDAKVFSFPCCARADTAFRVSTAASSNFADRRISSVVSGFLELGAVLSINVSFGSGNFIRNFALFIAGLLRAPDGLRRQGGLRRLRHDSYSLRWHGCLAGSAGRERCWY